MNKKGFTIVELLVVMAVIGILITLAVVGIQALQRSQRETVIANDMRNIQAALVQYYAKYRTYPAIAGDRSTEVKTDNFGPKQGVCLIAPLQGENVGDTFSCDIEDNSSLIFSKVITQQLGIEFNPGNFEDNFNTTYTNFDCTLLDTEGGNHWFLGYISAAPSLTPQTYALFSCSDNGKSINYGDRN